MVTLRESDLEYEIDFLQSESSTLKYLYPIEAYSFSNLPSVGMNKATATTTLSKYFVLCLMYRHCQRHSYPLSQYSITDLEVPIICICKPLYKCKNCSAFENGLE